MIAKPVSSALELTASFPSRIDQAPPNDTPTPNWIGEAKLVGEQLRQHAYRATDGTPVWLKHGHPFDPQGKPTPLGPHLYNGASGVCLFLAALGHVLEDQELQ